MLNCIVATSTARLSGDFFMSNRNAKTIIADLYTNQAIDDCIVKVVDRGPRDDFKQELFLILLEKPAEEIERIDQEGKILYYVVRIILNLIRQERNVYHKTYLEKKIDYDTEKVLYSRSPAEHGTIEERQEREDREDSFLVELEGIDAKIGNKGYPYHQELINLIVKHGGIRETSRQTGIPKTTVARAVHKVRSHLNDNVR